MRIAVVILNWNGAQFLRDFLPIVIRHSAGVAEVIVADNASVDGSRDLLKKEFPDIRLISLDMNYGFAEGYNRALAQVDADYYVLLNSDIEVSPGWIEPVVAMMENDPLIAAAQPKLLSWHERHKFEYAGAAGGFIDRLGYPFCRGRVFLNLEEDHGQYDDEKEVFWATGACLFVKSKMWKECGGLDADFFAHMEEIDFCWRLKNLGYKVMYTPSSTVYHIGGGTLPKSSSRKTYLNFRNNFSLLYKNLPSEALVQVILTRLWLDWVAGMRFLLTSGFSEFWAVVRAHLYFYRNIGKLRKKRRSLKQAKVSGIYGKNLVWQHYVRKKVRFSELDEKDFS